jgi:hypothetical protein
MIGNGAVHSEAVFRMLAYNALNGNEGVLGANDLKVTQLGTPAASVQIGVGACGMIGRGAAQQSEMYTARMPTVDTIGVAATGAGSGRSDLIIGRVEDPNTGGGWAAPSSLAQGPYMFTRVISGVPNTTRSVLELNLGYTAITLARVDQAPNNTGGITQAMIVDLRKVANPRTDRRLYTVNPGSSVALTTSTEADWFGSWSVDIPQWATRAAIALTIGGARHTRLSTTVAGTSVGRVRAILGTAVTQEARYDVETSVNNSISRFMIGAADTVTIPTNLRGTTQLLRIQGMFISQNTPISADTSTFATVDVEFQESAT